MEYDKRKYTVWCKIKDEVELVYKNTNCHSANIKIHSWYRSTEVERSQSWIFETLCYLCNVTFPPIQTSMSSVKKLKLSLPRATDDAGRLLVVAEYIFKMINIIRCNITLFLKKNEINVEIFTNLLLLNESKTIT